MFERARRLKPVTEKNRYGFLMHYACGYQFDQRCPHWKFTFTFRSRITHITFFWRNDRKRNNNFHFDRIINIIIRTDVSESELIARANAITEKPRRTCRPIRIQSATSNLNLLTRVTITILQLHWRFRCIHNFCGFGCWLASAGWLAGCLVSGIFRCMCVSASAKAKKRENHRFH